MKRLSILIAFLAACVLPARAEWTVTDGENTEAPGRKVDFKQDGQLAARLLYGDGQMKPFLHVYGDADDLLTEWAADQLYPHHRGVFIGWNRISSDLGTFDLWHFNNGGKMNVVKLDKLEGGQNSATLVATIEWRGGKKDAHGSDLLLTEKRTLRLSRPEGKRTQIDARFELNAARDLELGGDLQHAGIHFRGAKALAAREKETAYLWEPDLPGPGGKVASQEMKWCRLLFPIGERWYGCTQFNAPANPTEELSWRAYGRFGFFFKKSLKANESLTVNYRFITERAEAPAETGKLSPQQVKQARAESQGRHETYVKAVK